MRGVATLSLVAAFVLGCGHSGGKFINRRISASELTGVWEMTPQSVKDLRDVGYPGPIDPVGERFLLRRDGSCLFETHPPDSFLLGRSAQKANEPCTWKLKEIQNLVVAIQAVGQRPFGAYYNIREDDGGLVLWQYIADPDSWRFVEYARVREVDHRSD